MKNVFKFSFSFFFLKGFPIAFPKNIMDPSNRESKRIVNYGNPHTTINTRAMMLLGEE